MGRLVRSRTIRRRKNMMSSKGWLSNSIFLLILIVVTASFPALAQKGKQDQNANRDQAADYYNRGNERHKAGDLNGAIEDYTFAITFNSKFAMAWNNRGVIHYLKGDLDKAIGDCGRALELKLDYAG